jgi:hypothetical protein
MQMHKSSILFTLSSSEKQTPVICPTHHPQAGEVSIFCTLLLAAMVTEAEYVILGKTLLNL